MTRKRNHNPATRKINPQQEIQIPEQKSNQALIQQQMIHAGPLPHPAIMKGYENLVPGAAERLIRMVESQGNHRRGIESKVIRHDVISNYIGLVMAFIIVLTTLIGGIILIMYGKDSGGLTAIISGLSAPLLAFIIGRNKASNEFKQSLKNLQQ